MIEVDLTGWWCTDTPPSCSFMGFEDFNHHEKGLGSAGLRDCCYRLGAGGGRDSAASDQDTLEQAGAC
jgi:hypothetical protein